VIGADRSRRVAGRHSPGPSVNVVAGHAYSSEGPDVARSTPENLSSTISTRSRNESSTTDAAFVRARADSTPRTGQSVPGMPRRSATSPHVYCAAPAPSRPRMNRQSLRALAPSRSAGRASLAGRVTTATLLAVMLKRSAVPSRASDAGGVGAELLSSPALSTCAQRPACLLWQRRDH
jgi:hypothetical protein